MDRLLNFSLNEISEAILTVVPNDKLVLLLAYQMLYEWQILNAPHSHASGNPCSLC